LFAVTAAAALVHTHREPKGGPGKGEQRTVFRTQNIMETYEGDLIRTIW
jgi:hypothetical protein